MGGISTSTDFDPSTADMVLSEDYDLVGDDVSAILEMNRKAEIADAESERELDIGIEGFESGSEEDDDMLDFSNPTKGEGSDLLEANFLDKIKNLDKDALKGLGGKGSGPQSLGSSGSLKGADDGLVGAKGFRGMESPYASPKYYSPRGSVEFQKMVSGLLSDVFKTSIRKPTIRSLI
tara:strand:- start:5202 stop:5735 length:534 start_codon:yes stop_codon:yes gene_type:complete